LLLYAHVCTAQAYCGLDNGTVLLFDLRTTRTAVGQYAPQQASDAKPVHSVCHIAAADISGASCDYLLAGRLNSTNIAAWPLHVGTTGTVSNYCTCIICVYVLVLRTDTG
jgi:hypothetical protein